MGGLASAWWQLGLGRKVEEKSLNSGCSLKVEPGRLAGRLDMGWERKNGIKEDTKDFSSNHWSCHYPGW